MACELLLRDPLKMAGAWFERLWIHGIECPPCQSGEQPADNSTILPSCSRDRDETHAQMA
jgi:hypothetical protein